MTRLTEGQTIGDVLGDGILRYHSASAGLSEAALRRDVDGAYLRATAERPLSAYMLALLSAGLHLSSFDEPVPSADAMPEKAAGYRRVPWFL